MSREFFKNFKRFIQKSAKKSTKTTFCKIKCSFFRFLFLLSYLYGQILLTGYCPCFKNTSLCLKRVSAANPGKDSQKKGVCRTVKIFARHRENAVCNILRRLKNGMLIHTKTRRRKQSQFASLPKDKYAEKEIYAKENLSPMPIKKFISRHFLHILSF